ncbi:hypothetical protein AVEN_203251-1 [Araneus ventricosus]|uniref:Uncharacterized protein n=1 Tax=Araneus ventricosus TaxID=182803 RepID=A0A4Y2J903_ARAVE|nr:hypothetical protein AVEN_203251-1 [Araneus ventricosus]
MEKQLKCVLLLSLKEMALRRGAVLRSGTYVLDSISKFRYDGFVTKGNRESGLDGIPACCFLSIFFASEDSESIEVMFRNVDAPDRVKLVIHRCVLELFCNYMCRDGWQMVEVCLLEPALSKEDREKKKAFVEYLEIDETQLIKWEKWMIKRFFEILDETDASPD